MTEKHTHDKYWPLVAGLGELSNYIPALAATPPPTATATLSPTSTTTPTITPTATICSPCTATNTPTATPSPTITLTPTVTPTATPATGGALIPIGDVPQSYAGRQIVVSMFDPGDVVDCSHKGSAWMEVISPSGVAVPFTYGIHGDTLSRYDNAAQQFPLAYPSGPPPAPGSPTTPVT